jgi:hypothetical protein
VAQVAPREPKHRSERPHGAAAPGRSARRARCCG